jgi:ABC-type polysaccharide/polyol phosphate transport system ATPase subunit
MDELAFEVKDISKCFSVMEGDSTSLKGAVAQLFSKKKGGRFRVLNNVSFSVKKGESLGIIGKNGAGKSTLLKILSGIIQPDEGEINFYGKTVSILEIGTGFHPELTGRENIYLSASLYRFSRKSIDERFQAIVDFSGVGKFIDEPVKNYSSGMYLRLAFSIITLLDAEIYLIDEVINVGDADFQVKCKTRIEELIALGKTLVIVSHNLNEILTLCNRVIMMEAGEIVQQGGGEVILKYMTHALPQFFSFKDGDYFHSKDPGNALVNVSELSISKCGINKYRNGIEGLSVEHPFTVFLDINKLKAVNFVLRLKVFDSTGILVFACSTLRLVEKMSATGSYRIEFEIPANFLNDRMYSFDLTVFDVTTQHLMAKVDKILSIKMGNERLSEVNETMENQPGIVRPAIVTSIAPL